MVNGTPYLIDAGDGATRLALVLGDSDITIAPGRGDIDAAALARLAVERWRAGFRTERLVPRYLHAPDVTVAKEAKP